MEGEINKLKLPFNQIKTCVRLRLKSQLIHIVF